MSYFKCPKCGDRTEVFGHGGAKQTAEELNMAFLGEVRHLVRGFDLVQDFHWRGKTFSNATTVFPGSRFRWTVLYGKLRIKEILLLSRHPKVS